MTDNSISPSFFSPAQQSFAHHCRAAFGRWCPRTCSALLALLVLSPIVSLLLHALSADFAHWSRLLSYVLPQAGRNTLLLLGGVGLLVIMLGSGSAWLVTAYRFPGRNVLVWALLLPMAMPTYIIAYAYLDLLHPIGPVQTLLRELMGYTSPRQFRLPDIRSLTGAIVLLGFVLYPYVYLSTRFMFMSLPASILEAAQTMGTSRKALFWRIALPMARPAIAVGTCLALLETLNDIGASEFLGVNTLTVSIYTTWISRSDLGGAAQIALVMLLLVVLLITLEQQSRKRQRFANTQRMQPMRAQQLSGLKAAIALALGWLPVLVGFIAPVAFLAAEAIKRLRFSGGISTQLYSSLFNTLLLASLTTIIVLVCGLLMAWVSRHAIITRVRSLWNLPRLFSRIASLGYAIPGTILAIGLLSPLALADRSFSWLLDQPGLWTLNSMAALLIVYTIRFLTISIGGIEAGLSRIPSSLEQASRLLGEGSLRTLWRVHLPLLRPALAASALLVFVDAMKELPATLLLRPLNFETLATWLYADASRGTYEEGAISALTIVLGGLIPVILLAKTRLNIGRQDLA